MCVLWVRDRGASKLRSVYCATLTRLLIGSRGGLGGALFHGVVNGALARRQECLRHWGGPEVSRMTGVAIHGV